MSDLPKRTLGRTGLEVTALGYGAMELRGAPRGRPIDGESAGRVLNTVLDSGINYIDTSIDYGTSEEFIGKYISHRRSEYFLASKCGCLVGEMRGPTGSGTHVFTRENVQAGIEQSLRRMNTDHIDVMQFHSSPSKETLEQEDLIGLLLKLKEEGKIRFIGISGIIPQLSEHIKMGVFDVFQIPYSAMEREHEDLIAQAGQAGSGIVIHGGVAKGGPSPEKQAGWQWENWQRVGMDAVVGEGMSRMEFMLRFTLTHPEMDTTIVGTLNAVHVKDNVSVAEKGPLPADIYEAAKQRLATAGITPAT